MVELTLKNIQQNLARFGVGDLVVTTRVQVSQGVLRGEGDPIRLSRVCAQFVESDEDTQIFASTGMVKVNVGTLDAKGRFCLCLPSVRGYLGWLGATDRGRNLLLEEVDLDSETFKILAVVSRRPDQTGEVEAFYSKSFAPVAMVMIEKFSRFPFSLNEQLIERLWRVANLEYWKRSDVFQRIDHKIENGYPNVTVTRNPR
jgi:hypothetical protein